MTGARIATTLINSLRWRDKQFGLETMCTAGGQGMAMVLERLSRPARGARSHPVGSFHPLRPYGVPPCR
jgi:hypothetical protein